MPWSKFQLFIYTSPPCLPQCHGLMIKIWLFMNFPLPCLPQCHDLKSNSLFIVPLLPSTMAWSKIELFSSPLAFHNAWSKFQLFVSISSPCLPQCHDLKSNSLFKLPPPCLPQCHDLNSTFYLNFPPCLPQYHDLKSSSLAFHTTAPRQSVSPPCLPQCHDLNSNSLFELPPLPSTMPWCKI